MSKELPLLPEREAFEAWKLEHGGFGMSRNNAPGSDLGGYQDPFTNGQWEAWKARAAIEAQGVPDGLVDILREAASILEAVGDRPNTAPTNMRYPIVDELEGFAAMLASAPPALQAEQTANFWDDAYDDAKASVVQQEPVDYIVSVVVIKSTETGFNTQNKLYAVAAVSREEAHGKALDLAGADFPKYSLHTICSHPAPQAKQPLTDEQRQDIASIRKAEQWMFLTDFPVPSDVYAAFAQAIDNLEAAHGIKGE